jgi:predicted DNA-binding protein (MmcQ/YjbR family)
MDDSVLTQLREICITMPAANERLSHGEPCWFVAKGRCFASFADQHHDNRVSVWLAAPPGIQEVLIASEPTKFFRPPYVGVKGWIGVYMDVPTDWDEVAELVLESYRCVATPKYLAMLKD